MDFTSQNKSAKRENKTNKKHTDTYTSTHKRLHNTTVDAVLCVCLHLCSVGALWGSMVKIWYSNSSSSGSNGREEKWKGERSDPNEAARRGRKEEGEEERASSFSVVRFVALLLDLGRWLGPLFHSSSLLLTNIYI